MSDDDEKTRVVPRETEVTNTLPPGWRLHEFEVQKVLGEGGFGIVYLAQDTQLERMVAVKEYMPGALASRQRNWSISVKSERHHDTFAAGMRSFINEAKLLAQFDHPALVKVYRFWEANGTAYMAMPFYEGPTLKEALKARGGVPPDEAWLKQLLLPLMQALERLHAENCFHRDIAPDNIILQKGEAPLLLDFGAARRIIGDLTQALTVILKPGYAPVEQYAEVPSLKQGPWTDVYALAAVLYYAINGRPPLPSVGRMIKDDMKPAMEIGEGRYSVAFLSAIDAALAVLPEARPPSIAAFRELLFSNPEIITQLGDDSDKTRIVPKAGTATVPAVNQTGRQQVAGGQQVKPTPDPKPKSKTGLIAAIAVVVLAIGGAAGWYLTRDKGGGTDPLVVVDPAKTNPVVVPPPSTGDTTNTPTTRTDPVTPPVTPREVKPVVPTSTALPTDPAGWLSAVYQQRDASIVVEASADPTRLRIGRDKLRFRVQSRVDGYVYALFTGTDNAHLYLLFPNAIDKNNRIKAGQELVLPKPGWSITADGPPGADRIVVIVSPTRRDFSQASLVAGDPFSEFNLAGLARTARSDVLSGQPDCIGQAACNAGFGAARVEIEEFTN